MGLTAVTLLGDNTVPILGSLCRHLSADRGLAIHPRPGPVSSADAVAAAADADLVWGCGYLTCDLIDRGRLAADVVAAPVFDGEDSAVYRSVVVTADPSIGSLLDAGGATLAVNETVSWSGHHALVAHLASLGADLTLFGSIVETGAHRASLTAVARGDAGVAAIDHTVWEHARTAPDLAAVRVVECTRDWPAPPFAVRRGLDGAVRRDLAAALASIPAGAVTGLAGSVAASRSAYDEMLPPPHQPEV